MAECLASHLSLHSGTSRIVAALTVTSWLHATQQDHPSLGPSAAPPPAPAVPQDIVQALFGALAAPAVAVTPEGVIHPYAELAAMYSAMQQHAQVKQMLCPTY